MITNILTRVLEKLLPFPLYLLTSKKLSRKLSEQNRSINDQQPKISTPITNQHTAQIRAFRCGRYSASYNGCAAIALFNALLIKKRTHPLPWLIWQLETSGCLALNGKLGTNPFRFKCFLEQLGLHAVRYTRLSLLEQALAPGDTAILCIWNDENNLWKGAHFFTVTRQPTEYTVYNRLAPFPPSDHLSDIIGKGRFIVGYLLV